MDKKTVFSHVDHTLLKAVSTWKDVDKICREGVTYGMATVCIPPRFVKKAKKTYGDKLKVCTVIGFPLGYNTTAVKVYETRQAVNEGADEIDMVINLGDMKDGNFAAVTQEINAIKEACGGKPLKVIVETCYLTEEEKIAACRCVTEAGADFVKTSTGFGTGGATPEDIELFKAHIGPQVKMKASGGIRTREAMEGYLAQGVERIGASAAISAFEGQ
jgi:deoxyribose-phosphate aldolase